MKMKKLLLALAIVLPLSMGTVCVAAQHVHAHSYMGPYIIAASPGTHTYLSGYKVDTNGNVTPEYAVCNVVNYTKMEYYECACGDIIDYHQFNEMVHYDCGQ